MNANSTPAHLRPEACYVCGGGEHTDGEHTYWSNEAAARELTPDDRVQAVGSDGETYDPAAAYVAEHRSY